MKRLRTKWKAIIGWTLFFLLILLVSLLRYRITRSLQRPWQEKAQAALSRQPDSTPTAPPHNPDENPEHLAEDAPRD